MEYCSAVNKMKFASKSLDLTCTICKVSQTQKRTKTTHALPHITPYPSVCTSLYINSIVRGRASRGVQSEPDSELGHGG